MAWAIRVEDVKLKAVVATGLTAEPISTKIPVRKGDSPIVVDVKITSGTGTIKVQDSSDGFTTANTKTQTVSVTGAGTFSITFCPYTAADQADYPMRNAIRVIMDTTSEVVIDEIRVLSER